MVFENPCPVATGFIGRIGTVFNSEFLWEVAMAATEMTKKRMKSSGEWVKCFVCSKMPLSDNTTAVTNSRERRRNCCFITCQTHIGVVDIVDRVSLESKALAITTSDERRSARATYGIRNIATRKANTFLRYGINVRSRDILAAIESHISVAKIISHDDDKIWWFFLCFFS